MSYATVDSVKALGGLNSDDDYNMFRYRSADELDAAITGLIASASAIVGESNPGEYASPTTGQQARLVLGESYYVLYLLYLPLKSRKVTGTHWPLDQEGSERFQELIDVEYKGMAEEMLPDFLVISAGTSVFARPVFRVSTPVDPLGDDQIESEATQILEIVDEAESLGGSLVRFP